MDDQVSPALSARRATWLSLAVNVRRRGRQRANVNLNGLLRTTSRGFEDRGAGVHNRPSTSAPVQPVASAVLDRSHWSTIVRGLGCLIGCHRARLSPARHLGVKPARSASNHALYRFTLLRCRDYRSEIAPISATATPKTHNPIGGATEIRTNAIEDRSCCPDIARPRRLMMSDATPSTTKMRPMRIAPT